MAICMKYTCHVIKKRIPYFATRQTKGSSCCFSRKICSRIIQKWKHVLLWSNVLSYNRIYTRWIQFEKFISRTVFTCMKDIKRFQLSTLRSGSWSCTLRNSGAFTNSSYYCWYLAKAKTFKRKPYRKIHYTNQKALICVLLPTLK